MKKSIFLLITCMSSLLHAQENTGIRWTEGLSLKQVKEKAKAENKYIFLDCFTTWCGPCKRMDKEVYINDTVGKYFNDRFISVKVQMDKTEKDNELIKGWHEDTDTIARQYRITEFPSYVFLSPQGIIVHKAIGFKPVNDFVIAAQAALAPGQVYEDPYAEYDQLVADYKLGKKNYSKMTYIFMTALKLNNQQLAKSVIKDYNDYVITLKDEELYTKENIEYFIKVISSKSKLFHLFYPDGRKIDATMNKKGFAQDQVDQVILREEVFPFLQMGPGMISGGRVKIKPDPSWNNLFKKIKEKYDTSYANRNLLNAKIQWYVRQQNFEVWAKNIITRFEKYGVDDLTRPDGRLNWVSWDFYLHVNNKRSLHIAIKWMEGVVQRGCYRNWMYIDTYACLLYKTGKRQKAIQWEKKSMDLAREAKFINDAEEYEERLAKMKKMTPSLL